MGEEGNIFQGVVSDFNYGYVGIMDILVVMASEKATAINMIALKRILLCWDWIRNNLWRQYHIRRHQWVSQKFRDDDN